MTRIGAVLPALEAYNTWGSSVEREMDKKIEAVMKSKGVSREQAAQEILDSKDGWYVQTPEGEYLLHVIKKGE